MTVFGKTGSSFIGEIAICTLLMSVGFYLDTRDLLSFSYCLSGNIFENTLFHASITPYSTLGMIAGCLYCASRCGPSLIHHAILRHGIGIAAMLFFIAAIPHDDNFILHLLAMVMGMILGQALVVMLAEVISKLVRSI